MLQMRPDCEKCGVDLEPNADNALICSFECTFCARCVSVETSCPNCGGELAKRPTRAPHLLARFPASTERKFTSAA